jgi:predicted phage terminase large subunit-like protein
MPKRSQWYTTPPPPLTETARQILTDTIENNPYIEHVPTTRQALFLACMLREAFYGGAAGGGKSDALLMGAAQFIDVPDYAALLLRRTYADLSLPGAIMDRSHQWWDATDAHFDRQEKQWTFPSGATISFGFLATDADLTRYQSAQFQFIGVDEMTQFTRHQVMYLHSRLRRLVNSNVPIRLRGASNPGNIGHEWAKERYLNPLTQNEFPFFPARLSDNPYLDQAEYEQSLMNLDPITRAQLLEGDWDARYEGGMFNRAWFNLVELLPQTAYRIRYWDLAATQAKAGRDPDYAVGARVSRSFAAKRFTIEDITRVRLTPGELETLMRRTAELHGPEVVIYIEQEPGASGKIVTDHYKNDVLHGFTVRALRSTGPKIERARPFSAQAAAGNVDILRANWNIAFYDECEAFPLGAHDDQVDACSGAIAQLAYQQPGEAIAGGQRLPNPVSLWSIR